LAIVATESANGCSESGCTERLEEKKDERGSAGEPREHGVKGANVGREQSNKERTESDILDPPKEIKGRAMGNIGFMGLGGGQEGCWVAPSLREMRCVIGQGSGEWPVALALPLLVR